MGGVVAGRQIPKEGLNVLRAYLSLVLGHSGGL